MIPYASVLHQHGDRLLCHEYSILLAPPIRQLRLDSFGGTATPSSGANLITAGPAAAEFRAWCWIASSVLLHGLCESTLAQGCGPMTREGWAGGRRNLVVWIGVTFEDVRQHAQTSVTLIGDWHNPLERRKDPTKENFAYGRPFFKDTKAGAQLRKPRLDCVESELSHD